MSPRELATWPVASPEEVCESLVAIGWLTAVALSQGDDERVCALIVQREEWAS